MPLAPSAGFWASSPWRKSCKSEKWGEKWGLPPIRPPSWPQKKGTSPEANWLAVPDFSSLLPRAARACLTSLLILFTLGCSKTAPTSTEILWDRYGVPHILAANEEELFYAFGRAQTRAHGNLLLRLYGEARARAAEYWGEEHLESDRWLRTMGIPERAGNWYQRQTPAFRSYLDAFAQGINDYASENTAEIDPNRLVVLPVHATDILAHLQRMIHFTFVSKEKSVAAAAERWNPAGSNAWAIAPSRSASGHAMLLANPHLPWSGRFRFFEAHMQTEGVNIYGANVIGLPVLGTAFNEHLGWTHTVNTLDGQDVYELKVKAGGYRWNGRTILFDEHQEILKIKQSDGSWKEENLIVKRSIHGPVVSESKGNALSLRVVGLDQPRALEQWWNMGRARNIEEFEDAVRELQIPMFTIVYADQDGHVMHLFNGRVPVRPKGDWDWSGTIPGDTDQTLWTATHPYQDLPRVLDPPSGWLQNANDPPWTTTFPRVLKPSGFPPYMAPRSMSFRAQRSARMLAEDEEISFEELVRHKHSTRMELADRLLDELVPAAKRYGSGIAQRAAAVLEAWDRRADATSRGAVLFQAFAGKADERFPDATLFATPWSEAIPRTTPDGLSDPAAAVAVLEAAANEVKSNYGSLDVAWGDVHRLRIDDVDLPANGGPGELGIFRVTNFCPDGEFRFRAEGGDSFVALVEFSQPVRAMVLLSYGNSSQPGSPHRTDQIGLYSQKKLRRAWLSRHEIEENLSRREIVRGLQ